MTDQLLEAYDRFVVLYDLVELVGEGVSDESSLASTAHLSHKAVGALLAFMLEQGYIKTVRSDGEFKITVLGSNLLKDFGGMRKFLS